MNPKDMSDMELNRALAEGMGKKVVVVDGHPYISETNSFGRTMYVDLPDYCIDPAASLEVQAAAIANADERYIRNLSIVVWGDAVDPEDVQEWFSIDIQGVASLLNADPRQRAEAAYMTLREVQEHD